jgi:predicted alpha/beta hydrolase family esterase
VSVSSVVIMVPGRRRPSANHWQSQLAAKLPRVRPVAPLPRSNLSMADRVAALHDAVSRADAPVILVAHSSGVLVIAHWAARHTAPVVGALLATPPDLVDELPPWHPSLAVLEANGWLPIPRQRLPFPSILAASTNDPLSDPTRVRAMADAWGSRWRDLGPVGHLNPASGYGPWPEAERLIRELEERYG